MESELSDGQLAAQIAPGDEALTAVIANDHHRQVDDLVHRGHDCTLHSENLACVFGLPGQAKGGQ